MPGFDSRNNRNTSLNLMAGRLGDRPSFKQSGQMNFDGVENMQTRLDANGGFFQQSRMIFDKRRSFDRALLYSYQACNIKKVSSVTDEIQQDGFFHYEEDPYKVCRALINPDKLKKDYDDKILSVHKEDGFHEGDVFEWLGTGTYWLIYLQDLNEVAYFRSEIRRCQYKITWQDENGSHSSYAAITGPVETKIDYIQKHQISIDNPNYSINILMPRTKETLEYFRRYTKFYLSDVEEGAQKVCWRVEAIDWISTPGILEINAVEYYANETEDDIEAGLVGVNKTKVEDPNTRENNNYIEGEVFIKPHQVYEYFFRGLNTSSWSIDNKEAPVEFKVDPNDPLHIKLIWTSGFSGKFNLQFGKYNKTIIVESLFKKS